MALLERGTQEVSSNITGVSQGAEETGKSAASVLEAAGQLSQQGTRRPVCLAEVARPTSAVGHNRKSAKVVGISAFGGTAEVDFGRRYVCL